MITILMIITKKILIIIIITMIMIMIIINKVAAMWAIRANVACACSVHRTFTNPVITHMRNLVGLLRLGWLKIP